MSEQDIYFVPVEREKYRQMISDQYDLTGAKIEIKRLTADLAAARALTERVRDLERALAGLIDALAGPWVDSLDVSYYTVGAASVERASAVLGAVGSEDADA